MNKIENPFLKQLISEIAGKANEGRVDSSFSWGVLNEDKKSKKKKIVEADEEELPKKKKAPAPEQPAEEPAQQEPAEPAGEEDAGGLPDLGSGEEKGGGLPDLGGDEQAPREDPSADAAPEAPASEEPSEEDVADAQADANEKKAELEKAKAEKDKAEQEIEKNSYVKLGSSGGVQYLLGKILDHAFKTNSIDALASEMVQKLKIQTPEDFQAFSEEVAPYKILPGIGELLSSMKTMATKQSNTPEAGDESSE